MDFSITSVSFSGDCCIGLRKEKLSRDFLDGKVRAWWGDMRVVVKAWGRDSALQILQELAFVPCLSCGQGGVRGL